MTRQEVGYNEYSIMRKLNVNEIEEVNGGALAFGAAVAGGASTWAGGGDLGDVVAGAFMGGVAGFFGGAGGVLWNTGSKIGGGVAGGGSVFFTALPSLAKH